MPEIIFNNQGTTLASAITSTSATSISVTGTTGFPSSGNFRLQIDDELLLVTSVSGTTWTVTRGIEGTTPATHLNAAAVNHVVSAGGIYSRFGDANLIGLYSSVPSTPSKGDQYRCTDLPFELVYDGTLWHAFYKSFHVKMPAFSSWNTANLGTATPTQLPGDAILLTSGSGLEIMTQAGLPSPPYVVTIFTVTDLAVGSTSGPTFQNVHHSPILFNTSNNKAISIQLTLSQVAAATQWVLPSTFVGNTFFSSTPTTPWDILGQRISDDGTHRTYSFSVNLGLSWTPMFQESSGNYVAPDTWGVGAIGSPSYPLSTLVLAAVQT